MEMVNKIIQILDELNAKDIVAYDFEQKSPFFDYFVIATVNDRQASAASVKLKALEHLNIKRIEGRNTQWTLIDTGDIVIHLFNQENRDFYKFENRFLDIKKIY